MAGPLRREQAQLPRGSRLRGQGLRRGAGLRPLLRADQTINGINFKKGRLLVYCYDLARVHDDPARRTFELEPTLRAVEARMVRKTGVALDDAGDAPTPADTPRTGLSAAFAAVDGRLVVLSEAENAKTVAACDG